MFNKLFSKRAPPPAAPAPPPPPPKPVLRPSPSSQRLVGRPLPCSPPWDAAAACEADAALDAARGREYDGVALLLERLAGRQDASDPLTWRGHAWVDPSALKPLLSPALLLRISPPLAAQLLRHLAASLRARLRCAEAASAARASLALTRLLGYLEEYSSVLFPEAGPGPGAGRPSAPAPLLPLLEAALELLGCVLAHHTASDDLQALLALLQSSRPDGWLQPQLLRLLTFAAASGAHASAPRACFDCEGPAAGLDVPLQAPGCTAATLLLWVRLEAPPAASGAAPIVPLFHLVAPDGTGIAAAVGFDDGVVVLRVASGTPLRAAGCRTAAGALRPGAWACLVLVLQRNMLADALTLYVNGVLTHMGSPGGQGAPPFPPCLAEGGTPLRLLLGTWGAPGTPAASLPPLQGQLGPAALFAHACSASEVAALFAGTGPRDAPLAPPARSLADRRTTGLHGARGAPLPTRLAEKGHRRLVLALDPRAALSRDVGRAAGAATRARAPPDALFFPGTRPVLPCSFAAAIAAAGGPACLLPLLLSPDTALPLPPGCLPLPARGQGLAPPHLASVLAVLQHTLPTARHGEAAAACRAAAALLRLAPAAALTPALATAAADAARALGSAAWEADARAPRDGEASGFGTLGGAGAAPAAAEWEPAALLALDVRGWRRGCPEARRAYWATLSQFLLDAPESLTGIFGGDFLLHMLLPDTPDALPSSPDSNPFGQPAVADPLGAEERVALLRCVGALAEGTRPGVRATVARQLIRFVYEAAELTAGDAAAPDAAAEAYAAEAAAALSGGAAPAPLVLTAALLHSPLRHLPSEALVACVQLLSALLTKDGWPKPLPPVPSLPLCKKDGGESAAAEAAVPRGSGVCGLLSAAGGALGAALTWRLQHHPLERVSAAGYELRTALFDRGALAEVAFQTALQVAQAEPGVIAAMLARTPRAVAARDSAAAAQRWAADPAGGAVYAAAALRVLVAPGGVWAPLAGTPAAAAREAALPGGRPFWRLDEAAGPDGARRRLLPLDADGSCARAARRPSRLSQIGGGEEEPPASHKGGAMLPRAAPRVMELEADVEEDQAAVAEEVLDLGVASDGEAEEEEEAEAAADVPQATPARPQGATAATAPQPSPSAGSPTDSQPITTPSTLRRLRERAGAAAARAALSLRSVAGVSELVAEGALLFGGSGASGVPGAVANGPPLPPWLLPSVARLPRQLLPDTVAFAAPAELLGVAGTLRGTVLVTSAVLAFVPADAARAPQSWPLALATALHLRRRYMVRSALEMFLHDGRSVLLNLPPPEWVARLGPAWATPSLADASDDPLGPAPETVTAGPNGPTSRPTALHHAVLLQRPPLLLRAGSAARSLLSPARLAERSGWLFAWQRRELSTLEYLLKLNGAAGRSYHDLSQYPFLPWVVADYTSPVLDLTNPATFRDLSKPMGAHSPARAAAVAESWAALDADDAELPRFHHGSHYSTPGGVLYYLMRLAPFSGLHVELQGGTFDHADRLLASAGAAWRSASSSSTDCKELVPELFTCPAALRNEAELPLGCRQDGQAVGGVELPPWARGSAEEFCRLQRAALESEHVSAHLHEWIDLVFGCRQRGPAAEAALNVFFYSTYEGEVDVAGLQGKQRAVFRDQCSEFGQVPMQLFKEPHPPRGPPPSSAPAPPDPATPLPSPPGATAPDPDARAHLTIPAAHIRPVAAFALADGRVCHSIGAGGRLRSWRLPTKGARLSLEPADAEGLASVLAPGWAEAPGRASAAALVAAGSAAPELGGGGCAVLTAGWWDGSVLGWGRDLRGNAKPAVRAAQLGPPLGSMQSGPCASTCLTADSGLLAVGGSDGVTAVWRAPSGGGPAAHAPERPATVLRGHAAPITAVAMCARADIVATGAADGACLLHSLAGGAPIRALPIAPAGAALIAALALSPNGGVVAVHALAGPHAGLQVWSLNGVRLAQVALPEPLLALAFTADGRHLLAAGATTGAVLRAAHSLEPVATLRPGGAAEEGSEVVLLSAAALAGDALLLLGLADGTVELHRLPVLA